MEILLWFCFLVLIPSISTALLSYAFFWYEAAHGPHRQILETLAPGHAGRLLARGILLGVVSLSMVILLYPLGYWRRLWHCEPDPSCPYPPVILIHGLYHNPSAWLYHKWRLNRAGFKNVFVMHYNSWRSTLPDLQRQLSSLVETVAAEIPGKKAVLIGHSLGGLVSRGYIDFFGNTERLSGVMTLAAPHQGSKLAIFGLGSLSQSLRYEGPDMMRLKEAARTSDIPRLAVYSPIDNMVLPNHAQLVPYAGWEHYPSHPLNHLGFLFDSRTADFISAFLVKLTGGACPESSALYTDTPQGEREKVGDFTRSRGKA